MQLNSFKLNEYYGQITVKGKDAEKFLQGLLTCDMQLLTTQPYLKGALCNLKGRIRALFTISKKEDAFFLELPKKLVPIIITQLKKHALFSKITIEDTTAFFDRQEEGLFEDFLLKQIINGIPEVWLETTEQFLPHYLNLPALGAVSFTKGCYCGQEIVARMEYKANIKQYLKHVTIPISHKNKGEFNLSPGTEIEIGKFDITSETSSFEADSEVDRAKFGKIVSAVLTENTIEALVVTQL
jgi:folate-binding protein YgfZ